MQLETMFISLYTWPQRTGSNLNVKKKKKKIEEKIKEKKTWKVLFLNLHVYLSIIYLFV